MNLDIPDFLRIPQKVRDATWKGKRLTHVTGGPGKGWRWQFPKGLTDAECRALLREQAKAEQLKREERFALLAEQRRLKKLQAVATPCKGR